jgi:tetratricopeptide (TPR) repeat protein
MAEMAQELQTCGTPAFESVAPGFLAEGLALDRRYQEAANLADAARNSTQVAVSRTRALRVLAEACLGLGNPQRALHHVEQGLDVRAAIFPAMRSSLLLTRAEALMALGREDEAREAIRVARDRLLRIHATVPDDLKDGYLTGFRAHRRTMGLAHEWLGET